MVLTFIPGGPELVIIFFLIVLLFGGKKLPSLMKGLGQGIKEFKLAKKEINKEDNEKGNQKTISSQ